MQPQPSQNADLPDTVPQAPANKPNPLKRLSNAIKRIPAAKGAIYTLGFITTLSFGGLLSAPYWDMQSVRLSEKEWVEQREKARSTNIQVIITLIGNAATVTVALFSVSNSQRTTNETLKLTQKGQDSDRFNKATELLSSTEAYKQISGIHTLRVLAHIDPLNALLVEQIFASFIREKASKSEITEADKQKALSDHIFLACLCAKKAGSPLTWALTDVLSIRERSYKGQPVDRVPALALGDLDLSFSAFRWRYLCNGSFTNCDLRGAFFLDSTVVSCYFGESDLTGARFWNTKLCETNFASSNITNVDLSGATGLTWEHIWLAKSSGGTKLPEYLLNSSDLPEYFDRDYYDKHGWVDPVTLGRKEVDKLLQEPPTAPKQIQLPPLPTTPPEA